MSTVTMTVVAEDGSKTTVPVRVWVDDDHIEDARMMRIKIAVPVEADRPTLLDRINRELAKKGKRLAVVDR
jgi:hypothetical protein